MGVGRLQRSPVAFGLVFAACLLVAGVSIGLKLAQKPAGQDTEPVQASSQVGGPPNCWVGWEPSEGSVSFAESGSSGSTVTYRLKWRPEDLTFKTCRERAAFELETGFELGTQIGDFGITSTNLPRAYIDSSRRHDAKEVTFGIADANLLVGDKWYSLTYTFTGRLGSADRMWTDAARGYVLKPCLIPPYDDAQCVAGWSDEDIYGPSDRIHLISDGTPVHESQTVSWAFPARSSLVGHVVRDPVQGDSYTIDSSFVRHWIPDGGTYQCLVANGMSVVNSFGSPSLSMRWLINSFTESANATCTPATTPPLTVKPPVISTPPPSQPGQSITTPASQGIGNPPANSPTTSSPPPSQAQPGPPNSHSPTTNPPTPKPPRAPISLVSFTCVRNPPGGDGIYVQYDLSGIDGDRAHVQVTIDGYTHVDDLSWPTPGEPDNILHGSWGVLSDETMAAPGTCQIDATTTTGPIHASKQSN
jgi:hypothetical protein